MKYMKQYLCTERCYCQSWLTTILFVVNQLSQLLQYLDPFIISDMKIQWLLRNKVNKFIAVTYHIEWKVQDCDFSSRIYYIQEPYITIFLMCKHYIAKTVEQYFLQYQKSCKYFKILFFINYHFIKQSAGPWLHNYEFLCQEVKSIPVKKRYLMVLIVMLWGYEERQ